MTSSGMKTHHFFNTCLKRCSDIKYLKLKLIYSAAQPNDPDRLVPRTSWRCSRNAGPVGATKPYRHEANSGDSQPHERIRTPGATHAPGWREQTGSAGGVCLSLRRRHNARPAWRDWTSSHGAKDTRRRVRPLRLARDSSRDLACWRATQYHMTVSPCASAVYPSWTPEVGHEQARHVYLKQII